ncbi:MAG: hypothetical protein M1826_005667 [Phylliscum demangeonii]|nr:MAG: hypothetical protein M1826_005667 [Phylliscum demangeonii]
MSTALIPAQLSYLAIFNPSLGQTDDTLHDQIVYYSNTDRLWGKARPATGPRHAEHHDDRNERLRQIGLAQGMAEFARNFAGGLPVDSIETEQSRIVLHELERGWWILAAIDLTRLPPSGPAGARSSRPEKENTRPRYEYSAREVSPASLLCQQLRTASSIFLLHHGASLDEIYARLGRDKCCRALEHFWTPFARRWDVLLHGNPSVQIFHAIKLAAGGELGIGVGEEEWGSGERDVLEGFIQRTEGLVDLVVSRFGQDGWDHEGQGKSGSRTMQAPGKHDVDPYPSPADGVIFSGTGAIARDATRTIARWMEWLYIDGEEAYGVREDSSSSAPRKQRRQTPTRNKTGTGSTTRKPAKVRPDHRSLRPQSNAGKSVAESAQGQESASGAATLMKYLTLGYGSKLGGLYRGTEQMLGSGKGPPQGGADNAQTGRERVQEGETAARLVDGQAPSSNRPTDGRFLVGLLGDLDQETDLDDEQRSASDVARDGSESGPAPGQISLHTLYIQLTNGGSPAVEADDDLVDAPSRGGTLQQLRVVVYLHPPFLFTFLFEPETGSLALPAFYRALHHQLGPLQGPLLASTSAAKVAQRLARTDSIYAATAGTAAEPIYDLAYDRRRMTIHSTVPNIPHPSTSTSAGRATGSTSATAWSRIEALNVHLQILHTVAASRTDPAACEHTCKTSRGWWVVWMRVPPAEEDDGDGDGEGDDDDSREAFLVRKSGDARRGRMASAGSSLSLARGWTPGRLADGIGIDPRRYLEGLWSLSR